MISVSDEDVSQIRHAVKRWLKQSDIWPTELGDSVKNPWPRLHVDGAEYSMSHFNDLKKKISWSYEELVRTKGSGLDIKILFLLNNFSVTGDGYTKHHTPRRMLPNTPSRPQNTSAPSSSLRTPHRLPLKARLQEACRQKVFCSTIVDKESTDHCKKDAPSQRHAHGT